MPLISVTCIDIGGNKLDTYDWLQDIPEAYQNCDIVEVRFKNTRKGYFRNVNDLKLKKGDVVAVEASPGHDIGIVSLTGALVMLQLRQKQYSPGRNRIQENIQKSQTCRC